MKEIMGWASTIILICAGVLIACNYRKFWHDLLRMTEPFTAWFSRIASWHPLFFWGGVFTLAAAAILTAYFGNTWARVQGIAWTGFFAWFMAHIRGYIIAHPENRLARLGRIGAFVYRATFTENR
jgi:hypothetical protein